MEFEPQAARHFMQVENNAISRAVPLFDGLAGAKAIRISPTSLAQQK